MKSGANSAVVDTILSQIEKEIYGGITTKKFIKGFSLLKSNLILMRQDMRSALLLLGPPGFFFENILPTILSRRMRSKTNIILQGKCISRDRCSV
jgi:hypothetical protein